MLLIFIDLMIAAVVVLAVVHTITKIAKQHKQSKIDAALLRQQDAEHMAKVVKRLNPEKTLQNEAEVKSTLDKLS